MYVRIRGWEASPGKEQGFEAALHEIAGWIRESPGCATADMCRAVGVGQQGRYFTLFRFETEDAYYQMQKSIRASRILPRLEGLGHETWELVVGETLE
jgi:antibiotic biosynthesis monooxygenase (ABM) superfamily enzyme